MNKNNINVPLAGTEADSIPSAQNHSVSQPNANTNVVGSLFRQREIKFRGQRQSDGKWVYGFLYRDEDGEIAILQEETEISDLDGTLDIVFISYKVFSETVGEYTGLKDKNGKEIYEGDIMCWDKYQNTRHDVRWVVEIIPTRPTKSWSQSNNKEDAIVVGNIFENPELLQTLR